MIGQPVETQAQFDARRAAGWAFRASPEGRALAEQGGHIIDALTRAYCEVEGITMTDQLPGAEPADQLPADDIDAGAAEEPAEDVTDPADLRDDGMTDDEKPWRGQPLSVDVPPEQWQPVTDQPGPVEPLPPLDPAPAPE